MRAASRVFVVALVLGLGVVAAPAVAQEAPAEVTLKASDNRFQFGDSTTLSGRITPHMGGEEVGILDDDGQVRATAITDAAGRFKVKLAPRANVVVRAQWGAVLSDAVPLKVRAVLTSSLRGVRIFDRARVWGRLRPAHPGDKVELRVRRGGRVVRKFAVALKKGAYFSARFPGDRPGSYKVTASFNDDDHLPAFAGTPWKSPKLPSLGVGARGEYVKVLERKLRQLGYYLPRADRAYDAKTSDAMIAFNKVQGRPRVGSVSSSTWYALATPKRPRPRAAKPRLHFEVDQTKQVLYVVNRGRVTRILHVSTGAGGATRDGVFDVDRKLAGYSGNRLYYPSYFDGLRAVHGWPEAPTYPASHGCVRVPMWAAQWIYGLIDIGDIVRVYH